jgi:hypothetical protein
MARVNGLAYRCTYFMGYWEPEYKKNGRTGIGCILAGDLEEIKTSNGHLLKLVFNCVS